MQKGSVFDKDANARGRDFSNSTKKTLGEEEGREEGGDRTSLDRFSDSMGQ
jgi:hypothetical protein